MARKTNQLGVTAGHARMLPNVSIEEDYEYRIHRMVVEVPNNRSCAPDYINAIRLQNGATSKMYYEENMLPDTRDEIELLRMEIDMLKNEVELLKQPWGITVAKENCLVTADNGMIMVKDWHGSSAD